MAPEELPPFTISSSRYMQRVTVTLNLGYSTIVEKEYNLDETSEIGPDYIFDEMDATNRFREDVIQRFTELFAGIGD